MRDDDRDVVDNKEPTCLVSQGLLLQPSRGVTPPRMWCMIQIHALIRKADCFVMMVLAVGVPSRPVTKIGVLELYKTVESNLPKCLYFFPGAIISAIKPSDSILARCRTQLATHVTSTTVEPCAAPCVMD